MANKTQREFRKQMKQLEKEGKIPDNYYGRRRIKYGYSVSAYIVIAIIVLWRFGALQSIFYLFTNQSSYYNEDFYQNQYSDDYYSRKLEDEEVMAIAQDPEIYIKSITDDVVRVERYFIKQEVLEKSLFELDRTLLQYVRKLLDNIGSEKTVRENKISDFLDMGIKINKFALDNYDKPLTEDEKAQLEDLIKKAKDISFSLNSSIIN